MEWFPGRTGAVVLVVLLACSFLAFCGCARAGDFWGSVWYGIGLVGMGSIAYSRFRRPR